jgi:hypothetical protein
MVDYKCLEPSCAKVYRQEASFIAHITRHRELIAPLLTWYVADDIVNDGNYLPVLKTPRRRRA